MKPEMPIIAKIDDLIDKYNAERAYYQKEYRTSNDSMFWSSANRCADFIEDLRKLKRELENDK